MSTLATRRWAWSVLYFSLVLFPTFLSGGRSNDYGLEETNFIDDFAYGEEKLDRLPHDETYAINTDDIFKELIVKPASYLGKLANTTAEDSKKAVINGQRLLYNDFWRDKRGALQLAGMMVCSTKCDPLSFKGYGCYCGFLGDGEPVDAIDMCCKMHDWCYTTTSCMGLDWDLPYFVPFKWKCNGGSPYCIPGKTSKSDRNSCSHQLCECDREFAMCLQRQMPCPNSKALCKSKQRLIQNVFMGVSSGKGMHNPHKQHKHHKPHHHKHHKPHHHHDHSPERFIQHEDIHGEAHRFKPPPLINVPRPIYPFKGFRFNFG